MNLVRTLLLAGAWCLLTRELSPANVLLALALGFVLVWLTRPGDGTVRPPGAARARGVPAALRRALRRPFLALDLARVFLFDLAVSNVRIALLVARRDPRVQPSVVAVRTDATSEEELAVLSDLITMTPGTLTLDVEEDGRTLLVHVLAAGDAEELRRNVRERLGRRVRRLFE